MAAPRPYLVTVTEHEVPPRWRIPASERVFYASSERQARIDGVVAAHVREDLPPWKPLMRVSWPHSTAARIEEPAPKAWEG